MMTCNNAIRAFVLFQMGVLIAIACPSNSYAQRPPPQLADADLYFLAVGSEDYLYVSENIETVPSERRQALLSSVEAPINSATRVAEALIRAGARDGILLVSNGPDALIMREDVYGALTDLKRRIREDLVEDPNLNPRIVFYFMGHGLGDAAGRSLYMLPGNIVFKNVASQSLSIKLMKQTIWSWDILSALVNFRTHDSMRHFDDFYPSQLMPDLTSPGDLMAVMERQGELQAIDAARQTSNSYLAGGNPPVPFLALFDNCYGDVTQELTSLPALGPLVAIFSNAIDGSMGELLDEARAYYAARPGKDVRPVPDPQDDFAFMGPLALHLIDLLKTQEGPLTLRDLDRSFSGESSPVNALTRFENWRPYDPTNGMPIEADTIDAEIIPASRSVATVPEPRFGQGSQPVICCR